MVKNNSIKIDDTFKLSYWGVLDIPPITSAKTTIENFKRRIARLYEQGADSIRIGRYVRKWFQWLYGGLGMLPLNFVEIFFPFQTCQTDKT